MKAYWRDIVSAVLAMIGGVVVYAKLQGYSWWLIGSWKGALGVIAVLGLGIMLTNLNELISFADGPSFLETGLWLLAGTVVIGSLFADTTQLEFVWSAVAIGAAWMAQLSRHVWRSTHTNRHAHAYVHAHPH